MASESSSYIFNYFSRPAKPVQPKDTHTTSLSPSPGTEHTKNFLNITIKDWSKLTFSVSFSIPEHADNFIFFVDITKLEKILNLANYPSQWICSHEDPTQSVLFDLTTQKNNIVNINAKRPKSTRSSDLATITNLYESNMRPYTKAKLNADLPMIPYNSITELDSDNESNRSNNEQAYTEIFTKLNSSQNLVTEHTNTSTSTDNTNTVLPTNKPLNPDSGNSPDTTNTKATLPRPGTPLVKLRNLYSPYPPLAMSLQIPHLIPILATKGPEIYPTYLHLPQLPTKSPKLPLAVLLLQSEYKQAKRQIPDLPIARLLKPTSNSSLLMLQKTIWSGQQRCISRLLHPLIPPLIQISGPSTKFPRPSRPP